MNITFLLLCGLILALLFLLSAFFSASETSFFSLKPNQFKRIKRENPTRAERLDWLWKDQAMLLSTLLVGNNLVNFAIAAVAYLMAEAVIPGSKWIELIVIPITTILLLLFGEITPKRIAILKAEQLVPLFTPLLVLFTKLLYPISIILKAVAQAPVLRNALTHERLSLNDDELVTVVKASADKGILSREVASMVDGIMRISELNASDEMIPRMDIYGLDLSLPQDQWPEIIRKAPHRYLPVYRRTPDAIESFLDVVQYRLNPERGIQRACADALFVPENIALDTLLEQFEADGRHIACVLDEYGGTAGIISRSDILELVTDPVDSPSDPNPTPVIKGEREGTWIVDGTASLEEINHAADVELSADDADRIAGWITFHASGKLPYPGMVVRAQGYQVTILSVKKRRVLKAELYVPREIYEEETDELPDLEEDFIQENEREEQR